MSPSGGISGDNLVFQLIGSSSAFVSRSLCIQFSVLSALPHVRLSAASISRDFLLQTSIERELPPSFRLKRLAIRHALFSACLSFMHEL